jgi:hypothetical protein
MRLLDSIGRVLYTCAECLRDALAGPLGVVPGSSNHEGGVSSEVSTVEEGGSEIAFD